MRRDRYDICIIGSGAGAGPVAYELSKAGFSVVVLEKGPWIKTSQFTKDEIVAARRDVYYPSSKDEPQVIEWFDKKGNLHSKSNAGGGTGFRNGSCVGGSSNFMSGFFHRSKPADFELLSKYGAIEGANIADWPVSYNDMEPYFTKVESVIGVSGKAVKHKALEPRSTSAFPYPPLSENYVSQLLDNAAAQLGIETIPLPRAILSRPKGKRKSCYYSNYCGSYGCASDAKGSSRAALLDDAIATAQDILGRDPWDEEAVLTAMKAHAARQNIPAALRLYEAFHDRLQRDLNLSPAGELSALYEFLRAG